MQILNNVVKAGSDFDAQLFILTACHFNKLLYYTLLLFRYLTTELYSFCSVLFRLLSIIEGLTQRIGISVDMAL